MGDEQVSASQLGMMRPNTDAALRIESEYKARLLLMPYLRASASEVVRPVHIVCSRWKAKRTVLYL